MFTGPLETQAAERAWGALGPGAPGDWRWAEWGGRWHVVCLQHSGRRHLTGTRGRELERDLARVAVCVQLRWCPEVPKRKAFAFEYHFFSMCISLQCPSGVRWCLEEAFVTSVLFAAASANVLQPCQGR